MPFQQCICSCPLENQNDALHFISCSILQWHDLNLMCSNIVVVDLTVAVAVIIVIFVDVIFLYAMISRLKPGFHYPS